MSKTVIDTAMVLAAGKGSRMRPLTDHLPKPMISVAGKTLIERVLYALVRAGVTRLIVNTHYLAEILESYLRHLASSLPAKLTLVRETELLETGGGIVHALPVLDRSHFYVITSDVLWLDGPVSALERLAATFDPTTMDALLLLQPTERALGYEGKGDFAMDAKGELSRVPDAAHYPYIYAGLQILNARAMANTSLAPFSLFSHLYKRMQPSGALPGLYGIVHDGAWVHVGTPEGITLAENYLANV